MIQVNNEFRLVYYRFDHLRNSFLALYIHDPITAERYSQPQWLWMIVPSILYWIGRVWIIAHRGQMNEDPVIFAVRDKVSYLILVFIAIGIYLAF